MMLIPSISGQEGRGAKVYRRADRQSGHSEYQRGNCLAERSLPAV